MSTIPAMYNRGSDGTITGVTFYVNFTPYQSDQSHAGFPLLLEELKKAEPDEQRLIALTLPVEAVRTAVEDAVENDYLPAGVVTVSSRQITYNGVPLTGVLVDRILSMLAEGFDIMPMVRFLENLYRNPGAWVRDDEMYLWLENNDLPITQDGCFLAYKNVHTNFTSHHDGLTDNTPGTIVSMPREKVDKRRANECSTGLHFCSRGYLPSYQHNYDNVVVMLKINPADVVSIPSGELNTKGRAWKYEVLRTIDDPLNRAWPTVVDANGEDLRDDEGGDLATDAELEEAQDAESDPELAPFLTQGGETVTYEQDDDSRAPMTPFIGTGNAADTEVSDPIVADSTDAIVDAGGHPKDGPTWQPRDPFADGVRNDEINRINTMGIIALRHAASKAGFKGAWKGPKRDQLRAFLISQIS